MCLSLDYLLKSILKRFARTLEHIHKTSFTCSLCILLHFSRLNRHGQSTETIHIYKNAQFQSTELPVQSTEIVPENFSLYFQSTESPAQSTEFKPANFLRKDTFFFPRVATIHQWKWKHLLFATFDNICISSTSINS